MINVTAIKLPDSLNGYKDNTNENLEFLEPVSKINIFVGSNNSGKSRFMRELAKLDELEVIQNTVDLDGLISQLKANIEQLILDLADNRVIQVGSHIERDFLESCLLILNGILNLGNDRFNLMRSAFEEVSNKELQAINIAFDNKVNEYKIAGHKERVQMFFQERASSVVALLNELPVLSPSDAPQKVYIPTLRGLRQLDENHTDFYLEKNRKDYFPNQILKPRVEANGEEKRGNPEVFTGLTLYQRITDLLLGNNSERKLITQYQNFISEKLFEGKPVALIPNQKEKVVIVKIGNEKEQPIHHLGDGIQSAIILTFLPFVMQEQTFFFIEEPEMYLHPGLQRKILEFYSSLKQHTFFLTTHSNHFLDITIDIKDVSIFTFRKVFDESDEDELTPNFTIEAVDSGCESSLELLGVRNSSVFLVNATIWVEGITDRWYLRQMLNSYMDFLDAKEELKMRLEEDTHYSFVEYGGANITHWSFLEYEEKPIEVKRLCAKAVVIIDKDGEKKETRKDDLQKMLGERLIILPCREVENLLPYEVIKEVVSEYEKDDSLVLKDFEYEKYQNEYLGKFIEDKMLKNNLSRKGGYKADSGTLKDKVKFCEKALPKIEYENLPESTQEIIKGIYDFIHKQNS